MTIALHLLDTDTASFITKGRSPRIEARLADIPPDRLCVSATTRVSHQCPPRFRAPFFRSKNSRPIFTIGTPSYSTISAVA
jgi:hypothetical protein